MFELVESAIELFDTSEGSEHEMSATATINEMRFNMWRR